MTTIEIMDANWSGDALLLSINLTDGDRCTALTVRASREWDCDGYVCTLKCERVLGVEIGDVDQVLANNFVGAELERQVLDHDEELEDYARDLWWRADRRAV